MRAFRDLRPPGIYPEVDAQRSRSLDVVDTRTAGFVGLAQKGPLDEPVRIRSMAEFRHVYGSQPGVYLERAVAGFFDNGGASCFVVRVAHRREESEPVTEEHAASATLVLFDAWGKPTLSVAALNEGRWGNNIWCRVEQQLGASTLLTLDVELGSGEGRLNSTRGFERGALVRLRSQQGGNLVEDYVILSEVEDRIVRWGAETPLNHAYKAGGPTFVEVVQFDLFCTLRDRRESFRGLQLSPLSRNYAPRVVNGESQLVLLSDLQSRSPFPHQLPRVGAAVRLEGGQDGLADLTVEDFVGRDEGPGQRRGLQALAVVEDVAIFSVPDAMIALDTPGPQATLDVQRIQDAMVDICERLQDRFAILDAPPTRDVAEVRKWRARVTSSYAALYYPWILTGEGEGRSFMPPSGHMAGVFARVEREVGVHKAPGNELIVGASGVSIELREDDLGQLNAEAVNAIRILPGRGVRAWSARTLSDDIDWRFINVRRLFIMLRRAIERGTEWAVFEANEPRTWDTLGRGIETFLEGLWQKGALAGKSASDAFYVRCDESTNTEERVEAGQLVVEIGIAPTLPAEYLILHVIQKSGAEERASA